MSKSLKNKENTMKTGKTTMKDYPYYNEISIVYSR